MSESYPDFVNNLLKPKPSLGLSVIDLFAGCGGLALGFEAQGFATYGFEQDGAAAQTYRKNLQRPCEQIKLTLETTYPQADLVIGGPPCQPFSVGGQQKGLIDARDGFPLFIRAIASIKPKLWMFENVRGLMYQNKSYLEEIILSLEELGYLVESKVLNAAHYGVPQNRERLIVVGHRGNYKFPKPLKHSVTAGYALGELAFSSPPEAKFLTPSMDNYIAKYEKASSCKIPRDLHLDKPARTLTCRNIAAPTGDMLRLRLPDGRRRRILLREAARLQSFPDWFEFTGTETSQFYQIGNAVPPLFAYFIAESIKAYFEQPETKYLPNQQIRKECVVQMGLFAST